jgi:hypothetical protein
MRKSLLLTNKLNAMNVVETAKFLGIGVRKLGEITVTGDVPSYKIGRRRLYPAQGLIEWQNEQVEIERRKIRYKHPAACLRKAS